MALSCWSVDIADDGKLCYLQGATKTVMKLYNSKRREALASTRPVNHEVITSVSLQSSPFIRSADINTTTKTFSAAISRRKHQNHQNHHQTLAFALQRTNFWLYWTLSILHAETLLVYRRTKKVLMFFRSAAWRILSSQWQYELQTEETSTSLNAENKGIGAESNFIEVMSLKTKKKEHVFLTPRTRGGLLTC